MWKWILLKILFWTQGPERNAADVTETLFHAGGFYLKKNEIIKGFHASRLLYGDSCWNTMKQKAVWLRNFRATVTARLSL